MSFGLLTAIVPEDVPIILQRCAIAYRNTETRYFPETWKAIADKVEALALELHKEIPQLKAAEPDRKKPRVKL